MNCEGIEYLHNGDVPAPKVIWGMFAMTTFNDDMISIPSEHAT